MSELRYAQAKHFIKGTVLDVGSEFYHAWFDEQCDIARRVHTTIADVHELPYRDNEFDTVVCLETLEHVENPHAAVQELKRVAKKRIIISVPLEPWFSLPRYLLLLGWNKEHYWGITPTWLELQLGKPKFQQWFWLRWHFGVYDK